MKNDKFKKMSDEELVAKAKHTSPFISSEKGLAEAELYKRKEIKEEENSSIQRLNRNISIAVLIIATITLFVTVLTFFQSSPLSP